MGQTHGFSLEMAGQCCHWVAGMLTGNCHACLTGPGGNQADFGPGLDCKSPPWGQHSPIREPHKWLSTSQITQFQGLLCENPHVTIESCQALNPATLLPVGEGGPSHDCKEILEEVYASRSNLRDQPILDPAWFLYTNGTQPGETMTTIVRICSSQRNPCWGWLSAITLVCSRGRTTRSNLGSPAAKR